MVSCCRYCPTVLEAANLPVPKEVDGVEQIPMAGVSFTNTFKETKAQTRHKPQYFELGGNRAIYHEGWLARVTHWALN